MKTRTPILFLILLSLVFFSCATKKKREDLSALGKLYHNTTAEFNGYYNANVLLTESILKFNEQHQDNYHKLLDVYEYIEAPNPTALTPDLDKAIEKVSTVISLHRPSHWTDDCYLIMGKCQFLKKDFESAEETFRFMIREYPEDYFEKDSKSSKSKKSRKKSASSSKKKKSAAEDARKEREKLRKEKQKEIKKRNKAKKKAAKQKKKGKPVPKPAPESMEEASKVTEAPKQPVEETESEEEVSPESQGPDNYFLKHRPAYQEGQLWYARTLLERGRYSAADRIFRTLEADPKTFKYIRRELAPAMAYSAIKQKRYGQAITYLETAIQLAKEKPEKARYAYIAAQLYKRSKNSAAAYAFFEKVLKFRPTYEMEFNTRLQMAQNAWASGKASPKEVKDGLEKMLKDDKNIEFKDQIYYTLAQIALQANNREEAISYLSLSAKSNAGNKTQQAESYYLLASMFLENEDFVGAKLYYDSTLAVLAQNDERYSEVQLFSANLTGIAENLTVIQLQDSLLKISRMSPEEKKELALALKKREEEERLRAAEALANNTQPNSQPKSNSPAGRVGDVLKRNQLSVAGGPAAPGVVESYWAYDDKIIRRGKREFQKKWGNRPLADNWRVSSRINTSLTADVPDVQQAASSSKGISDEEIENILADVPTNPVEIAKAKKLLEVAYFNLGKLFREKLENYPKSVDALETLLERFPETEKKVDAWYYLYLDYTDMNNSSKARVYYDKILAEFPESIYARVLKNPNYYKETETEERKLNAYYEQAYVMFTSGNYQGAYDRASKSDEQFGANNPLRAKFSMLRALSLGSIQGKDAYIGALKDIIAKFPNTEEEKRAREILRLLGDDSQFAQIKDGENDAGSSESLFETDVDDLHYVLIVLEKNANLSQAKSDVGDYHRQFHKLDNLRVSNIYLGNTEEDRIPILVIRRFKDKDEAMRYYDGSVKNSKAFLGLEFAYKVYPVSQNNYRQILKQRSMDGYQAFFEENYLN